MRSDKCGDQRKVVPATDRICPKERYPSYRSAIPTAAYGDSDVALGAIPSALANAREMEWDDLKQGNADCNERFSYIWD